MKTTLTRIASTALVTTALIAGPAHPRDDDLWQTLVDVEVALTIDQDAEQAETLLATVRAALDDAPANERAKLQTRVTQLLEQLEMLRANEADEPSMREWILRSLGQRSHSDFSSAGTAGGVALAEALRDSAIESPAERSIAEEWMATFHSPLTVQLTRDLIKRNAGGDLVQAARLIAARLRIGLIARGPSGAASWTEPDWHDALVALLGDPRIAESPNTVGPLSNAITTVIRENAVTPELAAAMIAAHSTMPHMRSVLHGRSFTTLEDSLEPVYAALLEIGDRDDRRFAAARLAELDDPSVLLAFADDNDAAVRREVARSLTTRKLPRMIIKGHVGNAQVPALVRLAADEDATVRSLAVEAARPSPEILSKERWLELATDSDLDVKLAVADYPFTHRWSGEVLETLAASNDRAVAERIDANISQATSNAIPFELAFARLNHPALPIRSIGKGNEDIVTRFFLASDTRLLLWLVDQDAETLRETIDLFDDKYPGNDVFRLLNHLPAEHRAKLQRLVWEATDGELNKVSHMSDNGARKILALDSSLPWSWRWQVIPPDGLSDDEALALLREIIADPKSAENDSSRTMFYLLKMAGGHNEALLTLWTEDGLPSHSLLRAAIDVEVGQPRDVELAEKIIALGDEAPRRAWRNAVIALARDGSVNDDDVNAILLDREYYENHSIDDRVFAYIERQKDMTRFPALEQLFLLGSEFSAGRSHELSSVLMDVGTPSALDLLMKGAASAPSQRTRESCLSAARTLQNHLDELERFRSGADAPSTDSAAAELLALLGDDDPLIRAEAARGLATLGAVEHIARLVRMMRDEDANVRQAVREALDKLHTSTPSSDG